MARVDITEIIEGAQAEVANVNATLDSWETASTDVDDNNVRDEAIERRVIAKEFQVFGDTTTEGVFVGQMNVTTAASVALSELPTVVHCGGFNPEAGDEIIIRASLGFELTQSADCTFAIANKIGSGGIPSVVAKTRQTFSYPVLASSIDFAGHYTTTVRYTGTVPNPNLWFTIMAEANQLGGVPPTLDVYNVYITATLLRS